ncbi:hypothetical protein [Paenibacillus xylaniclasticus]|uniref:hypothetical protein n=1 Tax=Paenibacillus xylaniclasticus TaxID=588083 RepID=UPI000FD728E4|nr:MULTISPECIES: hypothetical protein [Paenibacillus]GFN30910.1 hypothetical protein PCURB6_11700 [Paenibacillus curdlanolyticus]
MSKHEHEDKGTICPWCHSEIVWDEEIGPEEYCPHCSNELTGYRTIQIGIDDENDDTDVHVHSHSHDEEHDEDNWADDSEEWTQSAKAGDGFRQARRSSFAIEERIERVLDDQLEVPECPSCRGYMLEAGIHTVTSGNYSPSVPVSVGKPLLPVPFQTVLYVCPVCYETSTKLSLQAREQLNSILEQAANHKQ